MTFVSAFNHLGELWSVARRCIWIAVVYAAIAALVWRTDLGFEWIISSSYDVSFLVPMIAAILLSYQTYTAALYMAENPPGKPVFAFAQQAIPNLVILLTLFAIPLSLEFKDLGLLKLVPDVWRFASSQVTFGCLMWLGTIYVFYLTNPNRRWWLRGVSPAVGMVSAWAMPTVNPFVCLLVLIAISWICIYKTMDLNSPGTSSAAIALTISLLVGNSWWVQARDPAIGIGIHIGPMASISFAAAGIIAVVVWYTFVWRLFSRKAWWALLGRSVLVVIASMAGYRALTGSYNEAEIHLAKQQSVPPQTTLDDFIERWLLIHDADGSKPYPVVLVAAEGGGIRAAYWTATALAQVEDAIPEFGSHVMAVSGVSGGSVGASIFAGLLHDAAVISKAPCANGGNNRFLSCAQSVAGADLLSAPLYGMLATDLIRGVTRSSAWPDRSHVLDSSLEIAWTEAMGNKTMSQPFSELWTSDKGNVPLVTPNLTSASSGGRVVLTPFSRESTDGVWLVDAARRMSLSSATLSSARFPGISPTALIHDSGRLYRTVDGGYADNSGTATCGEILETLLKVSKDVRRPVTPIVILLRNSIPAAPAEPSSGGLRSQVLGTLVDPLSTLDLVRGGASTHYVRVLRSRVEELGGIFEDRISLRKDFALTWMLSTVTRHQIDELRDAATAEASPCLKTAISGVAQGCEPQTYLHR